MKLRGYALGKELGRGSFAIVRKARSIETKMKHAVKIVDCSKAPDDFVTHFFPTFNHEICCRPDPRHHRRL